MVGWVHREYGVLMTGDNPETGEDVALKLVQEGFAKVSISQLVSVLICIQLNPDPAKNLNPDPDGLKSGSGTKLLTQSEKNYFIIIRFSHQKKSIEILNVVEVTKK